MKDTPSIDLFQISRALNASLNRPKDIETLRAAIKEYSDAGLMAEPEKILVSPRDNQPYKIVFDLPEKMPESTIIAYEQTGANGTRFVLTRQGDIKELSTSEFTRGPFPVGHRPPPN